MGAVSWWQVSIASIELTPQSVEIIAKVHSILKDRDKVWLWLTTKNPHFGYISPLKLINVGRGHRVLQFIDVAIDENKLPG
jgi:hypothetical protein